MRQGTKILSAAATALAGSILLGTLIGLTIANAVYDAYPMTDKQEESRRRRTDSIYEATHWTLRISVVAVPAVTLLAWWWLRRQPAGGQSLSLRFPPPLCRA